MKKLAHKVKQTLKNEIEFYLDKIKELDGNLTKYSQNLKETQGRVLAAYYLSGIYSCVEDIFEKIAKVFENNIENPAAWHRELLLRMRIEIDGVRPAVISGNIHTFLDEMRSFRHVFKESYMFSLDEDRIKLLLNKWNNNKKRLQSELMAFLKKV